MWVVYEQVNRPRICPRCKKLHLSTDTFCEHCLFDFLSMNESDRVHVGRVNKVSTLDFRV